jgi:hypothetical protein
MAFNLATLFVDIRGDDTPLQKQMGEVRSQLGVMGTAIGVAAGNLLTSAIQGAASSLSSFVSAGIKGSVELQDTQQATAAVFGKSAGVIFGFADEMAAKFGAVKTETTQAAMSFGQIFKGAGESADDAAKMGVQLAKLGMDLASFKGGATTNKDAFDALQGSLQGNFQGNLDRFNIFLTMADVNARAVAMGLAQTTSAVDDHARKLATLNLIMEKSKDQQGDLDRTADQTGNTYRRMTGTIANLAQEMGTALTPAIDAVLGSGANMATGLSALFESNKDAIKSWAATFADAVRSLPQFFDEFQTGVAINMLRVQKTLAEGAEFADRLLGIRGAVGGGLGALGLMGPESASPKNIDTAIDQLADDLRKRTEERLSPISKASDFSAMRDAATGALALAGVGAAGSMPPVPKDSVLSAMGIPSLQALGLGALGSGAIDVAKQMQDEYAKKHPFQSQSFEGDEFYYRMREQALSGPDDSAKKQLEEQAATRKAAERLVELIGGGALVARMV